MKELAIGNYVVFLKSHDSLGAGVKHTYKKGDMHQVIDLDPAMAWFAPDRCLGKTNWHKVRFFSDNIDALEFKEDLLNPVTEKWGIDYDKVEPTPAPPPPRPKPMYRYNLNDAINFTIGDNDHTCYVRNSFIIGLYGVFESLGMVNDRHNYCRKLWASQGHDVEDSQIVPQYKIGDMKAANMLIDDLKSKCRDYNITLADKRRKDDCKKTEDSRGNLRETSEKSQHLGFDIASHLDSLRIGADVAAHGTNIHVGRQTGKTAPIKSWTDKYFEEAEKQLEEQQRKDALWMKLYMSTDLASKKFIGTSSFSQRVQDPSMDGLEVKKLTVRKKRKKL